MSLPGSIPSTIMLFNLFTICEALVSVRNNFNPLSGALCIITNPFELSPLLCVYVYMVGIRSALPLYPYTLYDTLVSVRNYFNPLQVHFARTLQGSQWNSTDFLISSDILVPLGIIKTDNFLKTESNSSLIIS